MNNIEDYQKLLTKYRRHFHEYPEIGWSEFKTTADIITTLHDFSIETLFGEQVINREFIRGRDTKIVAQGIEFAKKYVDEELLAQMKELTGCVAIIDSEKPGPIVALRFDIDCVYVSETDTDGHLPNELGFASKCSGLMHACGHDGHIALGICIAKWLQENKDKFSGKVKILFQPAEEGVRGAAAMANSGILDDVNYFMSSHLGFIAKSGEVVVNPTGFLCTTKIDIRYTGAPSHAGAEPNKGKNALAAACNATTQMLGIARHGDGSSRINIGQIIAGEGRNVTPSYAEMKLEVRGQTAEVNQYMIDNVMNIAKGCAISFGVEYESEIMGEATDLANDKEMITLIKEVAEKIPNINKVIEDKLFGGSEDATILAKYVQQKGGKSIYFVIGTDISAGHHQAKFDINEKDLTSGFLIYINALSKLLDFRK